MRVTAKQSMNGATVSETGVEFRVWAPAARDIAVRVVNAGDFRMRRLEDGKFQASLSCRPGDRYFYVVDGGQPLPDPVSRLLPAGVHGPTEVVSPAAYDWHDGHWRGLELRDYILYELHVGTFSPRGDFAGVVERLDYLKRLGVSAIEIMPVSAFPGTRNWGYDGVSPYAVQASYGGIEGLKRLVDEAHQCGLAVILDVVYNHLGPEGNYLRLFGPYFTSRHCTPWGEAINYDGPGSEGVRRFIIENALYWIREYHLDGLRLDAVQTIQDDSPVHILAEIQRNVQELATELGREVCVIAETDENDPKLVWPVEGGGYGLNAVWSDDFHHAVHAFLTGEHQAYYQDFGRREQIVRALSEGFVFQGEHFQYWGTARGRKPEGMSCPQHVICIQNHDQVGNRAQGDRIDTLALRGAHKLVAALMLLAPETPLLFMGQEYGEDAPFQFFTDYGDEHLKKAVSEGRRNEFKHFSASEVPDPQDKATFERSKLRWREPNDMLEWYRGLLELRRRLVMPYERTCRAQLENRTIVMHVPETEPRVCVIAEFPDSSHAQDPGQRWIERMRSESDGYRVRVYEKAL